MPHCQICFFYSSKAEVANVYISTNTFSILLSNFTTTTSLSNQACIFRNAFNNFDLNLYLSFNAFFNSLIPYYTTNVFSNQLYMTSNAVNNLYIRFSISFNTFICIVAQLCNKCLIVKSIVYFKQRTSKHIHVI
jgi:hypothetical protein